MNLYMNGQTAGYFSFLTMLMYVVQTHLTCTNMVIFGVGTLSLCTTRGSTRYQGWSVCTNCSKY